MPLLDMTLVQKDGFATDQVTGYRCGRVIGSDNGLAKPGVVVVLCKISPLGIPTL